MPVRGPFHAPVEEVGKPNGLVAMSAAVWHHSTTGQPATGYDTIPASAAFA